MSSLRRGSVLAYLAYLAAFFLTLCGLLLNNVSFATNDYTWIVINAIGASILSSVLIGLSWLHMPVPGRAVSAILLLANLWTILDAGLRRLPACLA